MQHRTKQWGMAAMLALTLILNCVTDCHPSTTAHGKGTTLILSTLISIVRPLDPGGHGG
jgi:hypothetical protein